MESSTKASRKPLRLRDYDYSTSGLYFVTICAHNRQCLFGEVRDGVMHCNDPGRRVVSLWCDLPQWYPGVILDEFVVMPNHLHGIVCLSNERTKTGAMNRAPTENLSVGAQFIAPSLGDVVRGFKARCTVALRKEFGFSLPVWQRNYYEHVIRSEVSLKAIRQYIVNNPAQWHLDSENPERVRYIEPLRSWQQCLYALFA